MAARVGRLQPVLPAQRLLDRVPHRDADELAQLGVGPGRRLGLARGVERRADAELVRAGAGGDGRRVAAGDGQLGQRRRLGLRHRDDRASECGRGDRAIEQQHRVDGAGARRSPAPTVAGLRPGGGVPGPRGVAGDAGGGEDIHAQVVEHGRAVDRVGHVRSGPHQGRPVGIDSHLLADRGVVGGRPEDGHPIVALPVVRRFAALPAAAGGGAHHVVRHEQLGDQVAAEPMRRERAAAEEQVVRRARTTRSWAVGPTRPGGGGQRQGMSASIHWMRVRSL